MIEKVVAVTLGLALVVSPRWKQAEASDNRTVEPAVSSHMPSERTQRASRSLTPRARVILWASAEYPSRKDVEAFVEIIYRESRFNHKALNESSGAYGLAQALPPTKYEIVGADWKTNPYTQLKWAAKYIRERYGNPVLALHHHDREGWY